MLEGFFAHFLGATNHSHLMGMRHLSGLEAFSAKNGSVSANLPNHFVRKVPAFGVAVLISDKTDFQTKAITRDKEGHYIILKGVVQ